jgi:hypothetical protein
MLLRRKHTDQGVNAASPHESGGVDRSGIAGIAAVVTVTYSFVHTRE